MLGPFDPTALSAGLLTNLAYDILKYKSQSIDSTLVGRILKWAGIQEPDLEERVHNTLSKALGIYFNEHPEYALSDIEDFLRDSSVARQLNDHILDRQPFDEQQLQQLFDQRLNNAHSATKILFQRRGLSSQHLINDFLQCYRHVLREQLSVPQISILLDVIDQNDAVIHEIRTSEDHLKQYIDTLRNTTLSPTALQSAYHAGQQQLAATAASIANPSQAPQIIQTRLRSAPKFFTDGLCKGRLLHPAPDRYFVSHSFDAKTLADWRDIIAESLAHISNSLQPFQPYFAGDTLLGGFHLCSICERIYSTNFSLFLLPSSQDRNVYLELGIAIGLGVPFFLIQHYDAPIPSLLSSLSRYTKGGMFRTMRRELAGQVEEYDFGAVQFVKNDTNLTLRPHYVIAAGEQVEDEDVEYSVSIAIEKACTQPLLPISLSAHLNKTGGSDLKQLVEMLQTSYFAIYRVDEKCTPATFLALGISIGLNRPFLMIHKKGTEVPPNLRGLGIYQFANFKDLTNEIVMEHSTFFKDYLL